MIYQFLGSKQLFEIAAVFCKKIMDHKIWSFDPREPGLGSSKPLRQVTGNVRVAFSTP